MYGGAHGTYPDVKCVAWNPREEVNHFWTSRRNFLTSVPVAYILASASYDDTIMLFLDNPNEDWFCFATLTGHAFTLSRPPDGRCLVSASDDCTIRIWKRVLKHQWECVLVLHDYDRTVHSIIPGTGNPGPMQDDGESLDWVASTGAAAGSIFGYSR